MGEEQANTYRGENYCNDPRCQRNRNGQKHEAHAESIVSNEKIVNERFDTTDEYTYCNDPRCQTNRDGERHRQHSADNPNFYYLDYILITPDIGRMPKRLPKTNIGIRKWIIGDDNYTLTYRPFPEKINEEQNMFIINSMGQKKSLTKKRSHEYPVKITQRRVTLESPHEGYVGISSGKIESHLGLNFVNQRCKIFKVIFT